MQIALPQLLGGILVGYFASSIRAGIASMFPSVTFPHFLQDTSGDLIVVGIIGLILYLLKVASSEAVLYFVGGGVLGHFAKKAF